MSCTSNAQNLLFQVSAITQPSAFSHVTPVSAPNNRRAWIRREGWEVSEGRGGRTERQLSTDFLPPLSSESRPEGHPFYGHRKNNPLSSKTNIQIPLSNIIENTPPLYASTKALFPFLWPENPPTPVRKKKKQKKKKPQPPPCISAQGRPEQRLSHPISMISI